MKIIARNKKKINSFNKNIKVKFDNNSVSRHGMITYILSFMEKINFDQLLNLISYDKKSNSIYNKKDIIKFMIISVILGYTRFSHMDELRSDSVLNKIMNGKIPSEKVCRDFLASLTDQALEELREINKQFLEYISKYEKPREVILNIDDSVMTVFGNQEGTEVGYNPRYNGRASYKEKICTIANTDEIVNVTLEGGKVHINKNFIEFYKKCESMLPKSYIVKRVRIDRGAFDGDNFEFFENENIEYIVKAKMYEPLKRAIDHMISELGTYKWKEIDHTFSATEATFPMPSWGKARRFVIIRKKVYDEKTKQVSFEDDYFKYEYQAIVTNIDYLTSVEIFQEYNQRCDIENNIDEFKEGFAFSQNSQQNKKSNELFLLIKMISYNIHNAFKRFYMPEEVRHHEINTLRRKFYNIACNLVGNGKYQHISVSPDPLIKRMIDFIRTRLKTLKTLVLIQ